MDEVRKVFFFRDFDRFTGGHLKYFNYISHVAARPDFSARIYLTERSGNDLSIDWQSSAIVMPTWAPELADVLFVAGTDWQHIPEDYPLSIPVINLVQHVRHANPSDVRYRYLHRPAIRVCVSDAVRDALLASGKVRGPVLTVPAALDLEKIPAFSNLVPGQEVVISALKNKSMGLELAGRLRDSGFDVRVLLDLIPRADYLSILGSASVAVFLPMQSEGFYLPALEAMAMGKMVVCPDVKGNRQYGVDKVNILMPEYDLDQIFSAVVSAIGFPDEAKAAMRSCAWGTALDFSLSRERALFFGNVLDRLDELWADALQGVGGYEF